VWGVQPECIEMGTDLTATVESAVEPLVQKVLSELQAWGVAFEARGGK
jgi:Ni,Fe-hydrogenase maturation factor